MKRTIGKGAALAMAALLGLWLGAEPAGAQELRANVPFAFQLRDGSMPAGDYAVRVDVARRQVVVENLEGTATAQFFALPSDAHGLAPASLVFHKYGNTYFLDKVRTGSEGPALSAPVTRKERLAERAARANARWEVTEVRVPATRVVR